MFMRPFASCAALSIFCLSGCFSDDVSPPRNGNAGSVGVAGAPAGGAASAGAGGTSNTAGATSTEAGSGSEHEAGTGGTGGDIEPVAGSGGTGGLGVAGAFTVDKSKPDLITVGGQVLGATNGFGVQGNWLVFHADTAQVTGSFTGTNVCAQGSYPKVPNNDAWPTFWGGGISLILSSSSVGGAAERYDAPAHQFAGVAMTVTGSAIPHEIRLKYKQIGSNDSYCKAFIDVKSGDRLRVLVSEVTRDCWNPGGAHVDAKNLEHFELHVWPELAGDLTMDLCLSDMKVIATGEEGTGGSGGAGGAGGSGGSGGASAGSGGTSGSAGSGGASAGTGGASAGTGGT